MAITVQTNTYIVEYELAAAVTELDRADYLTMDDEDDIVKSAVIVYNIDESFGDEATFWLYKVRYYSNTTGTYFSWRGWNLLADNDEVVAEILVKVRASASRM